MQAEMILKNNWKITKASVETLAQIFLEKTGLRFPFDYVKHQILKGNKEFVSEVSKILQSYDGKYNGALKVYACHNIIPSVLRNEFAKMLIGVAPASTFDANYVVLGDGSTTPAYTDTKLDSETLRGEFTNRYVVDNVVYLDKFFGQAEVAGFHFLEAGVVCDGTPTIDTGFLLSRILMDETIGANETLTINATITITSAT